MFIASGVLVVSGVSKLRHPDAVVPLLAVLHMPRILQRGRLFGLLEMGLGLAAGITSSRPLLIAEGGTYLAFALIISCVLAARVPLTSCGCSGSQQTPPSLIHVAVNLLVGTTVLIAAGVGVLPLRRVWLDLGWLGIPAVAGAVAAVGLTMVVMGPFAELLQACMRVRSAGLVYQHASRTEMAA
jgi:methylamine utilization protein MauE